MLQQGATLEHNKYRIEGVIGRGGFGHVYRARERLTGETVAIKELVPNFVDDEQMVKRFIQEARATLRLKHRHIARTYGIFRDRGTYYLAMEYLPTGSLQDRLERGPLRVEDAVRIASDLCEALHYAHQRGVVHCDIKPANVLFDGGGQVQLVDFGIAHVSAEMMTRRFYTASGMAMGTVQYMAPEQLSGVRDDPRVDIYAMGVLLYRMVAGRPYLGFKTETTPAAQAHNINLIQRRRPRSLQEVRPGVPKELTETVNRALRKRPEERFASARAMRDALCGGLRRQQDEQKPVPPNEWIRDREQPIVPPGGRSDGGLPDSLSRLPVWGWALGALAAVALLVGGGMWLQRIIGHNPATPPPITRTPSRTPTEEPTRTSTPTIPANSVLNAPSSPSPAGKSTQQSTEIDLRWAIDGSDDHDCTYDVYLGTSDPPTTVVCGNIHDEVCDPGTLDYDTHYYWQVRARDERGATTTGPVWDFTTTWASIGTLPAPTGTQPNGLAWDGDYLWMSSYMREGGIYKLDPESGSVLGAWTPSAAEYRGYGGLAFDGTHLWEADAYGDGIYELSTTDCSVISSIPSPDKYLGGLAWDGRYLWVGGSWSDKLYKIEPSDGTVVAELNLPDGVQGSHVGLAYDGVSLWLSNGNKVFEIDPSDGEILFSKPISISRPESLAWDGEWLWVASFDEAMIYRISTHQD